MDYYTIRIKTSLRTGLRQAGLDLNTKNPEATHAELQHLDAPTTKRGAPRPKTLELVLAQNTLKWGLEMVLKGVLATMP